MSTLPGLLIAAALLFDPARTEIIDLTHTFDENALLANISKRVRA
jgi:hypothetical protein